MKKIVDTLEKVSERTLTVEERQSFAENRKRIGRRMIWKTLLALGLLPVLTLVFVTLHRISHFFWGELAEGHPIIGALISISAVVYILIGIPVYILWLRDDVYKRKKISELLLDARVGVYEGITASFQTSLEQLLPLFKHGLLKLGESHSLELTEVNGWVLRSRDQLVVEKEIQVVPYEYAGITREAYSVQTRLEDGSIGYKRHLNEEERSEIKKIIQYYSLRLAFRRSLRGVNLFYWFLAIMFTVSLFTSEFKAHASSSKFRVMVVLAITLIFLFRNVVKSYFNIKSLERDLASGQIILVDGDKGDPNAVEFLSESGLVWTIGGNPSPWRRLNI